MVAMAGGGDSACEGFDFGKGLGVIPALDLGEDVLAVSGPETGSNRFVATGQDPSP